MRGKTQGSRMAFRSGLRASSALAIGLGFILIFTSVLSIVISGSLARRMETEVLARNQLLAVALANDLATFLDGYRLALHLAGSESFWTHAAPETLSQLYPAFDAVLLVNTTGQVEFTSMGSREGFFDVSNRDFFIATSRTGQPYLSPSFIAAGDYTPTAVMAVPGARGLAVAYLSLKTIGEYIKSLPIRGVEVIAIVDQHGYYVAHRDPQFVAMRSSVALESWYQDEAHLVAGSSYIHKDGEPKELICWSPVPGLSGWTVMVSEDADSVFAQPRMLRFSTSVMVVGLSLAAMTLIMIILRLLDRDIGSLYSHATAVAGGNYDTQVPYQGFKDLAPLANGYRAAMMAVKERERRIQENEYRLATSLQEKEVLLKEIHHRVKNNLQLIISLLNLKALASGMEEGAFSESIDRVRVMATIHELLYESHDFSHIELGEYIRTIVDWIKASYAYGPAIPKVVLELPSIDLNIDSAVPCGLIINELFTNAIKYAFDATAPDPVIQIATRTTQEGFIELVFADNGKGLPPDLEPGSVQSLGINLIVSLSEQLRGKIGRAHV